MDAGMSELALPPRPQRVSVDVVLISRPCSWRADQFLSSQALQMLLPWIVPLRAEQFMATHHRSGSRAWRELVKLPTHETMHALQHYPFAEPLAPSPEDVTSVSPDPKSSVQLHGFTSSRIEAPALSFEHCMGSALMPRPVTEEQYFGLWLHQRGRYWQEVGPPDIARIYDAYLSMRQRIEGETMIGTRRGERLPQMMAQCARMLRLLKEDPRLLEPPTEEDQARAQRALDAMAAITAPIFWNVDDYGKP
jgi:hypothetical protein